MTGISWSLSRIAGLLFLGLTAYFIRDWRTLQLLMSIPTILTLAWSWAIPESPKWLLAKEKKLLALRACVRLARRNKDTAFFDECRERLSSSKKVEEDEVSPETKRGTSENVFTLVRNRILLKHILISVVIWFAANWAYYGMLYNIPNLPGGRYLNFIIGALCEACGYVLSFFILSRVGRRIWLITLYYTSFCFYLAFGLAQLIEDPGTGIKALISVSAFAGKGLSSGLQTSVHMFVAELFPTTIRTSSNGICGFSGRFANLVLPQLILLVSLSKDFKLELQL